MFYNPDDYAMDWRRLGAGYAVTVMAVLASLRLISFAA